MLKKIKQIITVSAFALLAFMPLAIPATAGAASPDIQDGLCEGASLSTADTNCATSTATSGDQVNNLIADVINIFSLVVGVVAVIMIIIGGFRYITSGGNDGNVASAKNTILYAIIGLVIVALAQFIVRFVLGRVTA